MDFASDPIARRIREAEQNDPVLRGRVIQGIADPAIFDESRGESIADMQEKSPNFLHWMPGDHTRLAGKMQMHYRLNFDGEGRRQADAAGLQHLQALHPHHPEPRL